MAEQGETSLNYTDTVNTVTAARYTESQAPPERTGKRRREEGECEGSGPKRIAKAQDVLFRIVVPSRQIGKVIGKEGYRIQKIREETKATIKIADAVAVRFCFCFLNCFVLCLNYAEVN